LNNHPKCFLAMLVQVKRLVNGKRIRHQFNCANGWVARVVRLPWGGTFRDPDYEAVVERVFVIQAEAFDWNCQQHITPRFTEEQIRGALAPIEQRMRTLEQENERLQGELTRLKSKRPPV
jgi:predicted pyridoxine 5'-phosphate oxidase superfamily flavin-nucleotide-binding protein